MPWTTPQSVTSGNAASSATFNSQVVDNLTFVGTDAPNCRLYRNNDLSVATSTDTAVSFGQERWDNQAMHSTVTNTSRVTIPTDMGGLYFMQGSISFEGNATGFRQLAITLNGTTDLVRQRAISVGAGSPTMLSVSTVFRLVPGDYLELYVWQNSGGALLLKTNANYSPEFSVAWLMN